MAPPSGFTRCGSTAFHSARQASARFVASCEVIAASTPAGVGAARQVSLRPGDEVEVEIGGVVRVRNPVRARNRV